MDNRLVDPRVKTFRLDILFKEVWTYQSKGLFECAKLNNQKDNVVKTDWRTTLKSQQRKEGIILCQANFIDV